MLVYFRIADRFNIIDKPNERSSHSEITIRGGGVVFLISTIIYTFYSGFSLPYFLIGLLIIGTVSFVDDIVTLSSRVRLPLHLLAVGLLGFQIFGFSGTVLAWLTFMVLATGVINAYNFMDGINGITAGYSLVVLSSLFLLNEILAFADGRLIIATISADIVFSFFNFRKKAKCFAGDVGSVSVAFIIVFLTASLIYKTGDFYYILLLAVYGVDSVLTIIHRLFKKENIFEAHRSHLYQWLVKPGPFTHLQMSALYMALQAFISACLILLIDTDYSTRLLFSSVAVVILGSSYIIIKRHYMAKYDLL